MSTASRSAELRLAIAMRGGVSLAVWMGGACCEMARLRCAAPGPSGAATTQSEGMAVYRSLLKICGYEDVDVDVLAGTSAGGLNGVLLGCHLVYGMPFGPGVRDLWLRLGDIEGLLRRSTPFHPPTSLMQGDEVFYCELRRALDDLLAKPRDPGWKRADSLRLILTATRLRPRRDWVRPTLGQPLLVGRSQAFFRFRHRPGLTDFPGGTARPAALDRLAYAARTTSSFPGAFEPGRAYVGGELPPPGAPEYIDIRGVSSETGYPDENLGGCAEMVDGGLLDNIPVAWAVRAIAGTPATRRVDRWLLFLQPVPAFPPKSEQGNSSRVTRLVRLAAKSLAVKASSESLRDDALELRAADAAAHGQETLAGVLPPTLQALRSAGAAQLDRYRATVGAAEAGRLVRLLEDPADVTGPDPLPMPSGPSPLKPLDEEAGAGSVQLFAALRQASAELLPSPRSSPLALARAIRFLLDWVRAHEAGTTPPARVATADCRQQLYTYRFAIATLIAARDRLLLRCYANALTGGVLPPDTTAAYQLATNQLVALMPALPASTAPTAWRVWCAGLARALNLPAEQSADGLPEPPQPYEELWQRVGALGRNIGRSLGPIAPYNALYEAAAGTGPEMVDALTAAETLLGPMRPDPLLEAPNIAFHTVSAANSSWATHTVLEANEPNTPKDLVNAKLSGNQLSNFAAFLSARWRLGDWTWGRLDAAASLVSVVATDERLAATFGGAENLTLLRARVAARMPDPSRFLNLWEESLRQQPDLSAWDRVRYALTALRQREILDEELPLIAALHTRGIHSGNRPEAPRDLQPLPNEKAFKAALKAFKEIGAEEITQLIRARDPRRAAARAGLLAWPAVQPSGATVGPRLIQGLLGMLKPLVWLMPLLSFLAPPTTLAAVALMWIAAAFSTGRWCSLPVHIPLCIFAMAALGAWAWRLRGPGIRWRLAPTLLVLMPALAVPPLALALADVHDLHTPAPPALGCSLVICTAYALAAAFLFQVGADRAWYRLTAAAATMGILAGAAQSDHDQIGAWWSALILYLVLFWNTAVFPWLRPRQTKAQPVSE
ncbi:DUF3376 domain-containing protein [Streptomyces cylindrosporus]|uniref:DUF3376 domain-containing protein n=1 Tax=Streptomyces cylindrosporus TaxID=2927583 RepID=A0ABS9YIE6_9ACTN|nr:DUF3376 domain-containing protein [Streptomyces cylindrosporus]MCI3277026.1 DUF3376 domain-containing protein [Streptomyces cylindrosporus]